MSRCLPLATEICDLVKQCETLTTLDNITLVNGVLTIFYTGEDGVQQSKSINITAVDVNIGSLTYNPITGEIILVETDGQTHTIDIGPFVETPITVTDSNTIDFTSSGTSNHTITGDVKISTDVGNIITSTATGIFAPTTVIPPTTVSNTVTGSGISRTISTTVNGVTGTAVSIPDTDAQTLSIVGNTVSISNGNSISLPVETVTTITNTVAGNKIADYTNESGAVVAINETITSISGNNYISENGTNNPIIQTNTLTLNGSNDLISTVNGVASTPLDLQGAIQAEETTTTLVNNANGTQSYTNEDGTITIIDNRFNIVGTEASSTTELVKGSDTITYSLDITKTLDDVKTSSTNNVIVPRTKVEYTYNNNNGVTPVAGVNFNIEPTTAGPYNIWYSTAAVPSSGTPLTLSSNAAFNSDYELILAGNFQARIGDYNVNQLANLAYGFVIDGVVQNSEKTIHNLQLTNGLSGVCNEVTLSKVLVISLPAGTHTFDFFYQINPLGTVWTTPSGSIRTNLNQVTFSVKKLN